MIELSNFILQSQTAGSLAHELMSLLISCQVNLTVMGLLPVHDLGHEYCYGELIGLVQLQTQTFILGQE